MSIENAIASVAVRDLETATKWYEQIFGRPAHTTSLPEVREWRFARGGWLQVYQLAERAGFGSFTLSVTSLSEELRRLRAMGVNTSQQFSGSKVNVAMTNDPDGNQIVFAEAIDTSIAR